jgi:hypothetical protein
MNRLESDRLALAVARAWGKANPDGMREARQFVTGMFALAKAMKEAPAESDESTNAACWSYADTSADVVDIAPRRAHG